MHSKPGIKLGNLLCSANRTQVDHWELKGIYEQKCEYCGAKYVGQTRVNFRTRMAQHKADVTSNKADENISGISKHARHCPHAEINWENPKIIATFSDKNKKNLQQDLLIRESLEIRRRKTATAQGLNDPQLAIRSNAWDPLLQKLKKGI